MTTRYALATTALFGAAYLLPAAPAAFAQAPPPADPQMQAVLDEHATLGPKPLQRLTPAQARMQPSPADAVASLLRTRRETPPPIPLASAPNRTIPGPAGEIPVKIYTPVGAGPFPVIVYFHGGGWVIATIETYDASARALASGAGAIVMSVEYRKGPEHPFPAAHDDAFAAYQWALANAASIGGDPSRIAVAGESAGGGLAAAVTMMARDRGARAPVHQLLVYPITNNDFNTPSYRENANASPLSRAAMQWFFRHYAGSTTPTPDPRLLPLRGTHAGLPPATVITAGIDPLRSEGEAYANGLRAAGVAVDYIHYDGVTHEFFGMAAVLDKARQANARAVANLRAAFGTGAAAPATAPATAPAGGTPSGN